MSASAPPAGGAHPLRPYATDAGDRNIFVAARPAPAAVSTASRSSSSSGGAAPVAVPAPRQQNRYVRLDDDYSDLSGAPSFRDALKGLALAGALQYTSTAIAMPFEVGKLLLQIQWVPRDDVWNAYAQSVAADEAQRRGVKGARAAGTPAAASGLSNEWELDEEDTEEERMEMGGEREQWREEEESHQQRDFGGEEDEVCAVLPLMRDAATADAAAALGRGGGLGLLCRPRLDVAAAAARERRTTTHRRRRLCGAQVDPRARRRRAAPRAARRGARRRVGDDQGGGARQGGLLGPVQGCVAGPHGPLAPRC
jgi:hypothetical protein